MRPKFFLAAAPLVALIFAAAPAGATDGVSRITSPFDEPLPPDTPSVPDDTQLELVRLASAGRCASLGRTVLPDQYETLRPLAMAAVASCQRDRERGEALFRDAEDKAPLNEIILALHATYLARYDPSAARTLWRKVLAVATDPQIQQLAERGASGGQAPAEASPLRDRSRLYGVVESGIGYQTNPVGPATQGVQADSTDAELGVNIGGRLGFSSGSVGPDYTALYNPVFNSPEAASLEQELSATATLHAGSGYDASLKPFVKYLLLGGDPYQWQYGANLTGVRFAGRGRHTLQASLSADRFTQAELSAQAGTTIGLAYTYQESDSRFSWSGRLGVEHTAAGSQFTTDPTVEVSFSNLAVEGELLASYQFGWIRVSFSPMVTYRRDDSPSVTPSQTTPTRRIDWTLQLQPKVVIPLLTNLELIASYTWTKYASNFDDIPLVTTNYTTQAVLALLRWSFTT